MAFTAKCPKCKQDAGVIFNFESGEKVISCCGEYAPAVGLDFNAQPEFLFKYRPHDGYSESWIVNEELFFASPAMFNDPFDSKVMYGVEGTSEQQKQYWNRLIVEKLPGIRKKKKWKIIKNAVKNNALQTDHENHLERMQKHIDGYYIASFSQKPDDLLMFAYYAKDHSGYCLKYRRSSENILSMARPVIYEKHYPKFSLLDSEFKKKGSLGDKVLFTKAKCWEHEDEWRVSFANLSERVLKSPHPILEGIILGCRMKTEQCKEIISLNKRRAKPVAMFEARKKKFEFALEIVPIEI
jgi:hypothetical protein